MLAPFFKKIIFFIIIPLLLSSCAMLSGVGTDNSPPPTPLCSFKPQFAPKARWSAQAGVGADGHYLKLSPAIDNNQLFNVDAKGQAFAFDVVTGHAGFCQATKMAAITGVAAKEGYIFFGTQDAKLVALSQQDGHVLWTTQLPNQLLAPPLIACQTLYAKTIDGNVCAIDKKSGCVTWRYEHSTPVFILRDSSTPQAGGNLIIVGFPDGKLAAYRASQGDLIWEKTIAFPDNRSLMSQLVDISADPKLCQDVIYAVTFQGKLAAIRLVTGEEQWSQPLSSYTGLIVTSRALIVTDRESVIWAFDKNTGCLLWKQEKLKYRTITAPVLQGCYFVVADKLGFLHWMSIENGECVARTKVANEEILSPPLVYQNHVFVMTQKGKVVSY